MKRYLVSRGKPSCLWQTRLLAAMVAIYVSTTAAAAQRSQTQPLRQSPPAVEGISVGDEREGELTALDAKGEAGFYDAYRLSLRRGDAVQVDMSSPAFDAYVDVIAPGFNHPLIEDDDGGRNTNSRLRFMAPVTGEYVIRAQGLEYRTGAYSLHVVQRALITPPPEPMDIERMPRPVPGKLGPGSAVGKDGEYYDLYRFEAPAGTRVRLSMKSSEIDSLLLLRSQDPMRRPLAITDDDSGDGEDAVIVTTLPEKGIYVIHASGWYGKSGSYTLELQRTTVTALAVEPQRIELNRPIQGSLAFEDKTVQVGASDDKEFLYRLYSFNDARAGQPIVIELDSDAFDPFVEVGSITPVGFAIAASNDDVEGGNNARLRLVPQKSGVLIIRARTVSGSGAGEFTLRVRNETADDL